MKNAQQPPGRGRSLINCNCCQRVPVTFLFVFALAKLLLYCILVFYVFTGSLFHTLVSFSLLHFITRQYVAFSLSFLKLKFSSSTVSSHS